MKTTINIHNCEEFFLLYVDGELSAEDRLSVERFIADNSHLASELDMLQQAVLGNDPVLFEDREILYRNGSAEINPDNAETHFLLYVDNELDAAARTGVETFVLQHPALQEPFLQLKQAKLVPETVVFPDKASLYRKEKKERPLLYLRWQRVAVAAAFIGLAVLAWRLVPSGRAVQTGITAVNLPADTKKNTRSAAPGVVTAENSPESAVDAVGQTNHSPQIAQAPVTVSTVANRAPETNTGLPTQPVQNDPQPANQVTGQQETMPGEKTVLSVQPKTQLAANTENSLLQTEPVNTKQPEGSMAMTAQPAIYRELDTEEGDDKKSLYVGSIEINKDKLRGFFRKATSLFRGKAKEDEKTETTPSHSRSLR
ncbi:anti-sigma factor [Sediminibacterium soli]|uniref:hypothetical protein n=1 Tax=Sediminibacterium soli TaxID=2698829 RepID=UPI001379C37A|nr:hypothetical protein [Sediminibacterium soli]NCI47755.1 hypothetical protein [Sediminibacterium soli]